MAGQQSALSLVGKKPVVFSYPLIKYLGGMPKRVKLEVMKDATVTARLLKRYYSESICDIGKL